MVNITAVYSQKYRALKPELLLKKIIILSSSSSLLIWRNFFSGIEVISLSASKSRSKSRCLRSDVASERAFHTRQILGLTYSIEKFGPMSIPSTRVLSTIIKSSKINCKKQIKEDRNVKSSSF